MKYLISIMAMLFALPALADRPAGYAGTLCDPDRFVPVISERTGNILYWNNPTCTMAGGGGAPAVSDDDEADKDPKKPRRDRRPRRGGRDSTERPFPGIGWGVGGNPREREPGCHPVRGC